MTPYEKAIQQAFTKQLQILVNHQKLDGKLSGTLTERVLDNYSYLLEQLVTQFVFLTFERADNVMEEIYNWLSFNANARISPNGFSKNILDMYEVRSYKHE